ncbi:hypothetical protein BKA82DRAFT_4015121 [Pisolithus tinctorius]|nr:hypothetical protein BKA82DRAFT_4015121 [Pisolithus tinctorius]
MKNNRQKKPSPYIKKRTLGLQPVAKDESSEPEGAVSFNHIHALHDGLFGHHSLKELKDSFKQITVLVAFPSCYEGYQLLQMLLSYLELDRTLELIERKQLVFGTELKDIQNKGAAHNYSTQPNEKMHGSLKDAYQDCSNGKDIALQVFCVNHHHLAMKLIRSWVDAEANYTQQDHNNNDIDSGGDEDILMSFSLPIYLNCNLNSWKNISFQLQEHAYLKVNYKLRMDWQQATDYLQCNPSFHGKPHYDSNISAACNSSDNAFRLTHVKACLCTASIFIPIQSIIRGALLYPDPKYKDEYFVVEHIDGDVFHHVNKWNWHRLDQDIKAAALGPSSGLQQTILHLQTCLIGNSDVRYLNNDTLVQMDLLGVNQPKPAPKTKKSKWWCASAAPGGQKKLKWVLFKGWYS